MTRPNPVDEALMGSDTGLPGDEVMRLPDPDAPVRPGAGAVNQGALRSGAPQPGIPGAGEAPREVGRTVGGQRMLKEFNPQPEPPAVVRSPTNGAGALNTAPTQGGQHQLKW